MEKGYILLMFPNLEFQKVLPFILHFLSIIFNISVCHCYLKVIRVLINQIYSIMLF